MTRTGFWSGIALAMLLGATGAYAHDDAYLDTIKAPNGGQLRMAGVYHFELVVDKSTSDVADKPVVVHVTDHAGQKVPTTGATGTATLLAGRTKATIALVPDGDNRLKGSGRYASTPDLKAVVAITPRGQGVETARFTPLAPTKNDGHADHQH